VALDAENVRFRAVFRSRRSRASHRRASNLEEEHSNIDANGWNISLLNRHSKKVAVGPGSPRDAALHFRIVSR